MTRSSDRVHKPAPEVVPSLQSEFLSTVAGEKDRLETFRRRVAVV